ncbi:Hypothetical predicted protein [Pelobates cultripes]|uniref:Uncharacterized protein n=1 Tax=Pelobates cultripes TaxID=61616 RepID=A0AAD1S0N3_PELCU|nr:Hypothetical predicted protein [Pelobates cultripes]
MLCPFLGLLAGSATHLMRLPKVPLLERVPATSLDTNPDLAESGGRARQSRPPPCLRSSPILQKKPPVRDQTASDVVCTHSEPSSPGFRDTGGTAELLSCTASDFWISGLN